MSVVVSVREPSRNQKWYEMCSFRLIFVILFLAIPAFGKGTNEDALKTIQAAPGICSVPSSKSETANCGQVASVQGATTNQAKKICHVHEGRHCHAEHSKEKRPISVN